MPSVFQMRVELLDIDPPIWRGIVVPSSLTLLELHAVIQGAMGWQDYHLHSFKIAGRRYEVPDEDGFEPEPGHLDERGYWLAELLTSGAEFFYEYDFGDSWQHRIVVEEERDAGPVPVMPHCIAGERACPPEDCGGPYDYPELLEALSDAKHPKHEDAVDWAGSFDPETFSVAQANNLIGALCALYRERGQGFLE